MALIVLGWLLSILALTYQGLYTLRTGKTDLFLLRSARPQRLGKRLAYSLFVYLFPAVLMASILANALATVGASRVRNWILTNLGILFWLLCALAVGLLLITQPRMMLRWLIRDHPELPDTKGALAIMRLIGFVGGAIALVGLSRL